MKLPVFILLVMVSCCLGHKGRSRDRYRYSKNYRFRRPTIFPNPFTSTMMPPTTTMEPPPIKPISFKDTVDSARIGVRVPPKECVISFEDFVQHVVNMDYISPYDIDNDMVLNPEVTHKWSPRWEYVNETTVRRLGSYWDNLTGKCTFADGLFSRADETKAIFGATSGRFANTGRRDYILSFSPSEYIIQYVCYDGNKINEFRCPNSEILLLFKEQRTNPPDSDTGIISGDICLNDIPWQLVEYTWKNCLGQQFVDDTEPQIMWLWDNAGGPTVDCAKPGTEAFRREIENGK
ncbi:uncharacterized protein LOC128555691 [Mercenaria mercenaria]|uniref:uncharacterized protein LOC128555691 n=1 Tax=Mercenaria mercenaria TaxID=6596 RepID=UPI00234E4CAA|nr:uncharacterized protein LOC128555691 [Mercenaria mercenaria]